MDTMTTVEDMKARADESFKDLQQDEESQAKDCEARDDRVIELKKKVDESL